MFYAHTQGRNPVHTKARRAIARLGSLKVGVSAAEIVRGMVLLLVGLLLLCIGLMCFTGRYDVGVAVIGSVLFISLAATNYARC